MSTPAESAVRADERTAAIAETVAQIRKIEHELGIKPYSLHQIKQ